MKKVLLLAPLLVLLTLLSSCEKINDLLTFTIEDSQSVKIASGFPVNVVTPVSPITVPTRSDEKFKNTEI